MMPKAGRNDPCPCGSGKKFKQCCLDRQPAPERPAHGMSPQQLLQRAMEHHRSGRLREAEGGYRELLRSAPRHPQLLYNLGLVLRATGKLDEAASCFRQAAAADPGPAEFPLALGNCLKEQGKADEAAAAYLKALAIRGDFVEAHNNLGTVRSLQGRFEEAVQSYRAALAVRPDYVDAQVNLGNVLRDLGRPAAAAAAYRAALALQPDLVEVQHRLGMTLLKAGRPDEAVTSFRAAVALTPGNAGILLDLGCALRDLGRLDEAVASFRNALSLQPDLPDAHFSLATTLGRQWRLEEAVASYTTALSLKPDLPEAACRLGNTLTNLGRFDEAFASYRRALEINPGFTLAEQALIFSQQYHPDLTNDELYDQARAFGGRIAAPFQGGWCLPGPATRPTGRIRIGFVSGDLRHHPVGFFLEGVLRHLDRDSFSYHAYFNQADFDGVSRRLWSCFDRWTRVNELTDDELAAQIREDGITLLVDLSGHTKDNRLGLFARKPAPIQVSWLGYANTTGLTAMDYILADPVTLPAPEERFYTETVWRLPETYLCFTPPEAAPPVTPLPAVASGAVTFGCFGNPAKVNDRVVAVWARILQAVPDSLLFSKHSQYGHETACESLRRRFQRHGIPPGRLRFAGDSSRAEYLASYGEIDCMLDTFPFPGLTTTCEALWMGVPTLTLGLAHGLYGHNGELVMTSVGLAEWVATSEDDYVAKARVLTEDIGRLAELRPRLRQRLLDSPLCAAQRFAGHLEEAFRGMVARQFGETPAHRAELRETPVIEIISATRLSGEEFWSSSPLGCSLRRLGRDPRLVPRIAFDNRRGLPEIYNERLGSPEASEILVFIHDDVWIDDGDFVERVIEGCGKFDLIGVTGNRRRVAGQPSWAFVDGTFRWDERENLSGRIAHGPHPSGSMAIYGEAPAPCELLDGVFLAARKETLTAGNVTFDPRFDFHCYDMDFCRSAREKGLRLGTWPVELTHGSRGPVGTPQWQENLRRYREKWGEEEGKGEG